MAKFGTQFYIDFFGFNKKLFEDDWNDDQKYVVKLKQKGEEIVSISFFYKPNSLDFSGPRAHHQGR